MNFEEVLQTLQGWLGRNVSLWIHIKSGADSIAYMSGQLTRGESLPDSYPPERAALDREVLMFHVEPGGFFLGRNDFIGAQRDGDALFIDLESGIVLQVQPSDES